MDTYSIERKVPIERKIFTVSLGSNDRGEFIRLTESAANRYSTSIVIPIDGVVDLMVVVAEVLRETNKKS